MINPTWLKTFCTLVEVGHFTQTANKLFMTQSGVSQHVKKLEAQLETELLIRDGKSFSLTDAGYQLNQKGRELLRSSEELETLIKQDEQYEGRIKIASPGSIGLKLYPYLLEVQHCYPKLIIDYGFAPNHSIEHELAERQIDLGIITKLSEHSHLTSQKIATEPLALVTASTIKEINWENLIELGFISHPDAAHHGNILLSKNFPKFEHIEQFPHMGFSNQISLILEPVSKGFGFTVLPLHAAKAFHSPSTIRIQPLKISVSENLYLCNHRRSILPKRIKYIQSLIIDYLR